MNLYSFHYDTHKLKGYDDRYDLVPSLVFDKIKIKRIEPTKQDIIALTKNPLIAYKFALQINKGPWPEGEEAIAKDPQYSYYYAVHILNERFIKGERIILKELTWIALYAQKVLKRRWPEGEKALLNQPKDTKFADLNIYYYIKFVIDGPWPEAEKIIINSPFYARIYATAYLKHRWKEAEKIIKTNDDQWAMYCQHFPQAKKSKNP
jgi:hypothetical protein